MSFSADLDRAGLSILLDLRHPWAYLALHPAIAFAESLQIDVNWLPLSVPPLNPPSEPRADDDRGTRHRRYRAQAIAREIDTYAQAQGLVLREFYRSGDVEAAHLGWLWLRDRQPEQLAGFLIELFRAYWSLELDASRPEPIAALLKECGADADAFLAWAARAGPGVAAALARELRDRGLFQVPAYVLGEDVFYGRQHLPMLRWILEGRTGAIPI